MGTNFWLQLEQILWSVKAFIRRFRHISTKHRHSIYTRCLDCKTMGIGFEHDPFCGNCGSQNTIEYYPCGKSV